MSGPQKPRCTLARFQPSEMDVEVVKAEGWVEHDIFVIRLNDWRMRSLERQVIEALGNRIYGRRRNGR